MSINHGNAADRMIIREHSPATALDSQPAEGRP